MCKTATRLSADRLAAESPRVIHQSCVTMSHLCRRTILKRPGGGGRAERERLLAARHGNPTPHEGSRKKVTLWENWNCMCVFNCALYFKGQFAALSLHFRFAPPQTGTCNLAAPTSMNNWPCWHWMRCVSEAPRGYFITTWCGVTASAGRTCVVWGRGTPTHGAFRDTHDKHRDAAAAKADRWGGDRLQTVSPIHV